MREMRGNATSGAKRRAPTPIDSPQRIITNPRRRLFLSSVRQSSKIEAQLGSMKVKAMPIPTKSREYATLP